MTSPRVLPMFAPDSVIEDQLQSLLGPLPVGDSSTSGSTSPMSHTPEDLPPPIVIPPPLSGSGFAFGHVDLRSPLAIDIPPPCPVTSPNSAPPDVQVVTRPPSPQWSMLKSNRLDDPNLVKLLKEKGYTDPRYWSHITMDMLLSWEKDTDITIKEGVKVKFMDLCGSRWKAGTPVEVQHNESWQIGEVIRNSKEEITIMCKSAFGQTPITVSREDIHKRVRERTFATQMQSKYEQEIMRLKKQLSRASSSGSDNEPELSISPVPEFNNDIKDEFTVKEEPIDGEFDWTSLSGLKWVPSRHSGAFARTQSGAEVPFRNMGSNLQPLDLEPPYDIGIGMLPLPSRSSPKVANFPTAFNPMTATCSNMMMNYSQARLPAVPKLNLPGVPPPVPLSFRNTGNLKLPPTANSDPFSGAQLDMDPFSG